MSAPYLLNGYLTKTLMPSDNVAVLDSAAIAYLASVLGSSGAYILIGNEKVKITGIVSSTVKITRFCRGYWSANTPVTYVLTSDEVLSGISASSIDATISGQITFINNNFEYPKLNLFAIAGVGVSKSNNLVNVYDYPELDCSCGVPAIPDIYDHTRVTDANIARSVDNGDTRAYV